MEFNEFKDNLFSLAADSIVKDGKIVDFIIHYFIGKPIPHLEYHTKILARCNFIKENETVNIERCSFPPDPTTISLQRANFAGQQLFYCATNSDAKNNHPVYTALVETLGAKIKDESLLKFHALLSTWKCNRALKLWVLPFSKRCCEVNPRLQKMESGIVPLIQKAMPDSKEEMKALEFISDCFWIEKNLETHYRITAGFYNSLMFFNHQSKLGLDGLMYPSCHTKGEGINVVLQKDVINNKALTCDKIEHVIATRNEKNLKKIAFQKVDVFNY